MTLRRWAALAALCWTALAAAAAHADCKLTQIVELPVTMVGTRPMITLYINGKPTKFLVDSGSDFGALDTGAAQALGLKATLIDEYVRGVGGEVQMQLTTIKSFGLSKDLSLGEVSMLVFPGAGDSGAVGLVGENLLGLMDIEYDLPHGAIRFFRQSGGGGTNLGYWSDNALELPLTHTGSLPISRDRDPGKYDPNDTDRHVRAIAEVNGQKIVVTFDTGASRSILNQSVAARAGVSPSSPGAAMIGMGGGIGPKLKPEWVAPFDSFSLGGETINHTRLRFGDLNQVSTDMLLGADFFLSHRIFIANSLHKAFISYAGGPVFRFDDASIAAAKPSAPSEAEEPKDAEGFIRRAAASSGRRDFAGADADLTKAIGLDAKNADALVQRARARLALGRNKEAMADLDRALEVEPASFDGLLTRGSLHAKAGDMAKAKVDLEAAGKIAVPDGRARLEVAEIYEEAKAYREAIAQYDAMLAADSKGPLAPEAFNGRCWVRAVSKQDLDKALADCNAAHRMAPLIASYIDSRGLVHARRGELDQAIADYDEVLRMQPKTALALYARGVVKQQKGLKAAGEADLSAAIALEPKVADRARFYGISAETPSPAP